MNITGTDLMLGICEPISCVESINIYFFSLQDMLFKETNQCQGGMKCFILLVPQQFPNFLLIDTYYFPKSRMLVSVIAYTIVPINVAPSPTSFFSFLKKLKIKHIACSMLLRKCKAAHPEHFLWSKTVTSGYYKAPSRHVFFF